MWLQLVVSAVALVAQHLYQEEVSWEHQAEEEVHEAQIVTQIEAQEGISVTELLIPVEAFQASACWVEAYLAVLQAVASALASA